MDYLTLDAYNYDLPEELIAQTPLEKRDDSRLMLLGKTVGSIAHRRFYDIIDYLAAGDVLVINDSRVLPARLFGQRATGAKVEFVMLEQRSADTWESLVKPGRKALVGTRFDFGGVMEGEIVDVLEGGSRLVRFDFEGSFFEALDKIGQMPLPGYIHEKLEDKSRYQTVYARENGSAAAPTAGLHFTPELLSKLRDKGVLIAPVMLHVGLGTFRPVKVTNILEHKMHEEFYSVSEDSAKIINDAKSDGRRIIAVGTTSCRTLESAFDGEKVAAGQARTGIFIYPGYKFNVVDCLITNFHLPQSTLLMLISALAGRENVLAAYSKAIEERYRFFSFGDAMFIHDGGICDE